MVMTNTSLPPLPEKVMNCVMETRTRLTSMQKTDFISDALFQPSTHLLNGSGKLLRSTLVFLGAYTIEEDPSKFVDMAIAIELLHTSSLIHDDIVDKDTMRRGVQAVHTKYGSESAILAGDALISEAIQLSCKYNTNVINAVSKAAMDMCAGEALDFKFQDGKTIPSVNEYLQIASLKCASLIAVSCAMPAIYLENPNVDSLRAFGKNIGMAFQIKDDISDIVGGDSEELERERSRPNLVTALQKEFSVSEEVARSKATEINKKYLIDAEAALKNDERLKLLMPYANAIAAEGVLTVKPHTIG